MQAGWSVEICTGSKEDFRHFAKRHQKIQRKGDFECLLQEKDAAGGRGMQQNAYKERPWGIEIHGLIEM